MLAQCKDEPDIRLRDLIDRSVLSVRVWQRCCLPAHSLPFAVALQERAGVEVILDLFFSVFVGRPNKAESNNRSRTVLLNANVFRAVGRNRFVRLWWRRRFRTHVT